MHLFKGKNYLRVVFINLFLIVLVTTVTTVLITNLIEDSFEEVEKKVVLSMVDIKKTTGENIVDTVLDLNNNEELSTILERINQNKQVSTKNKVFTFNFMASFFSVLLIFMLLHILNYILIKREQRKYIDEVDTYIDSIQDRRFDFKLDESDESIISKLNNRFNKLGKSIEVNYDNLETDKLKLKDSIADISHQVKTPLAALNMYNEILLDGENLDSKQLEFLTVSKDQISRMKWLITALLKLSRLEANSVKFNKDKFKLRDITAGFGEILSENIKKKNLTLTLIGDLDSEVELDLLWTREAVLNIVKNATEHCYTDTEILVEYISNEVLTGINIYNEGENISSEDLTKIFTRFYKNNKSYNSESVGIGLNLSKQIVEGQKGNISAENTNNGVKFSIAFLK